MFQKLLTLVCLLAIALFTISCGNVAGLVGLDDRGVVIAKRAQIRSSGAVVAADLLEVQRGQRLMILDEDTFENEKWYNVRADDEDNTEGWIEARYVLAQKTLERSQALAEEDRETPAQAAGQLRAASNLRLTPDRATGDNIMLKLNGGDTFEIVGWKYVAKTDENADERDDKPKNAANQANNRSQRRRERAANAPDQLDEKFDVWYKVRLNPSVSPAPAGWVYGKQVELQVPSDIISYRTGREFVAWGRLDDTEQNSSELSQDKDAAKPLKPGSWVILERSNNVIEPNGEEPDFDRIRIMGYDKLNQEHYKVYRSGNVKGFLPLRLTGEGDSRAITVTIKDDSGSRREFRFGTYKDSRGNLKVNVPSDIPKDDKSY